MYSKLYIYYASFLAFSIWAGTMKTEIINCAQDTSQGDLWGPAVYPGGDVLGVFLVERRREGTMTKLAEVKKSGR